PQDWLDLVNTPQTDAELAALRRSLNRGAPYGSPTWQSATAATLGLSFTLRPHGRPRREHGTHAPEIPSAQPPPTTALPHGGTGIGV
ncbi:MAG: hypothetical protein WBD40_17505, partial [Tepidisphaeraceae bacterium]